MALLGHLHLLLKVLVILSRFYTLDSGICFYSQMEWNYYLVNTGTEIYYEGYINQQLRYNGSHWKIGERIVLNRNKAVLEMDPKDNGDFYPIGHFFGDMFEPNRYSLSKVMKYKPLLSDANIITKGLRSSFRCLHVPFQDNSLAGQEDVLTYSGAVITKMIAMMDLMRKIAKFSESLQVMIIQFLQNQRKARK